MLQSFITSYDDADSLWLGTVLMDFEKLRNEPARSREEQQERL